MRIFFLICLALLSVTCSDDGDNNTCSVTDPATELPWLKEIIELREDGSIDITIEQATYGLKTVFLITPCCITCYGRYAIFVGSVYDCNGDVVSGLSLNNKLIKNRKVIWKTPAEKAGCW